MSCKWIPAKTGKKFVVTELGGEDARIRSKFEANYVNKRQYEKRVPESWIAKGYVMEVAE